MKITFFGQAFELHPSGALLWISENMLIASDLHLEKGSYYARHGYFLPPYDSRRTLERLCAVLEQTEATRLMLLGDCFHDVKGHSRLGTFERPLFDQLLAYDPIWIKGNHDGDFVPDGFESHNVYNLHGICFRHEARPGEEGEVSGHFHPKAELLHKGGRISKACFVEDGKKLFLPAFGAYTGGLSVNNIVFSALLSKNVRLHVLGNERIYTHSFETETS